MSQQFDPASFTAAHAADPNTPIEVLAAIANQRPDLRAALASNPAAPADLLSWLGSMGDPQVAQAIAQRGAAPAVPSPAAPAAPSAPTSATPAGPAVADTPVAPAQPVAPATPGGYADPNQGFAAQPQQGYADPNPGFAAQPQQGYADPVTGQPTGYQDPALAGGYAAQGPDGYPAPGQPGADPNAQFGTENFAAGGYDQVPPPEKKSKAPMIVGLGVAGALVLGAGAYGAYKLWFSGPNGSATPVAAAESFITGLADGDVKEIYGVTSPVETRYAGQLINVMKNHFEEIDSLSELQSDIEPDELVDLYDLTVDGLNLSEEALVADETTRVTIQDGTFVLDVDADKTVDLVRRSVDTVSGLTDSFGALGGMGGVGSTTPEEFTAENEAELREQIDTTFPVTLTFDGGIASYATADGTSDTATSDDAQVSFVTVKEGGNWFVSPLLTIADYGLTAGGISERGSIKAASEAKGAGSPEEAGEAFFTSLQTLLTDKDAAPLFASFPAAERRTIDFLGSVIDHDAISDGLSEIPPVELTNVSFATRDNSDGVARLELKTLDIKVTVSGASVEAKWNDGCLSSPLLAEYAGKEAICLDDPELEGFRALGLDQLSFVALQEDNGWFVSAPATVFDAYAAVAAKLFQLAQSGELTPEWFEENFSGMTDLFPGAGMGSGLDPFAPGATDPWGSEEPGVDPDLNPFGEDEEPDTDADTGSTDSRPAGALQDELSNAAKALDAYLAATPDAFWPGVDDLAAHGYTAPDTVFVAVMDFQDGAYCIGGYSMADLMNMETGSIDNTGQYFAESMSCGKD